MPRVATIPVPPINRRQLVRYTLARYPKSLTNCGNHAAIGLDNLHNLAAELHVETSRPDQQQTVPRPVAVGLVRVGYSQTVARPRQVAVDVIIATIDQNRPAMTGDRGLRRVIRHFTAHKNRLLPGASQGGAESRCKGCCGGIHRSV